MTDVSITDRLSAPFPPDSISWRVGSIKSDKSKGMALAFIDARDVMDRLDDVVGAANWQDRYEFHGARTVCYLSLRIDGEWITKADGAGDSDVEAEKGAISDALKRAAVKWGIGRYLYDLVSPWVELEPAGRSYRIKPDQKAKLHAAAAAAFRGQALPRRQDEPKNDPLTARADVVEQALRDAKSNDLEKVWVKASKLLAELSTEKPDRLKQLTELYESLIESPF